MKVLFFSPHAEIWIHAFPEALVAEALAQEGSEILYVGCGGLLNNHCISMNARGVPFEAPRAEKNRVCRLCTRNKDLIHSRFDLSGIDLSAAVNAEDLRVADAVAASVTPQSCLDLSIDGVEVGRIATYELLIQNKKTDIVFSDGEWQRYLASVRNCVLVLRVMGRVLESDRPDRIVVYNSLYSVNRILSRLAEIRGIPQYFLHAGDNLSNRLQTLILARGHAFSYYGLLRDKWVEVQDQTCSADGMRSGTDHFLEVARGRSLWAYSAAPSGDVDLRKRFGIEPGRRVICATMSSDDERFSGEIIGALPTDIRLIFPRQVDWINALVRYVEHRSDLSLIIRIHPREFPNKREGVLSEHAKILKGALANLPDNARVNWPTDNVSLYDLANIVDVFANAWSSAGMEMAWLGIPVVLYSHDLTIYPSALNYVGTTEEEYFQKIEQALNDGWDAERIRSTYRWCAIVYRHALLDISDSFSRRDHRSLLSRVRSRMLRKFESTWDQRADCRKRATRLRASGHINRIVGEAMSTALDLDEFHGTLSLSEETDLLRREVARLVVALYGPTADDQPGSLASKLRHFANRSGPRVSKTIRKDVTNT